MDKYEEAMEILELVESNNDVAVISFFNF